MKASKMSLEERRYRARVAEAFASARSYAATARWDKSMGLDHLYSMSIEGIRRQRKLIRGLRADWANYRLGFSA